MSALSKLGYLFTPSHLSLVIPVADEPRNETLPLVLETVARYAPWLKPVLVGNPLGLKQYGFPVIDFIQPDSDNPVGTTTRMLALALERREVTDPFVWSNDDIFLRAPVTLDDLYEAGATARGLLRSAPKTGRYGKLAHATSALLRQRTVARPVWDYERHVPLVVNKRDMRQALRESVDVLPRSLYQNLRLDEPFTVAMDVKVWNARDVTALDPGPFISTGDRVDVAELRHALGLD